MSGLIVVDVGNTRVKWGRCEEGRVTEVVALPNDAPDAWQAQFDRWPSSQACPWFLSGVHPGWREALAQWLRGRAVNVTMLLSFRQLPLVVKLPVPDEVGIDRLFNAVAANTRRAPGFAAVMVDSGSAVTVDLVDDAGAFCGGAIFPGLRLMAEALAMYTARLPTVVVDRAESPPGTSTEAAIRAGIVHAVIGGIERLVQAYNMDRPGRVKVYVTGGDACLLLAGQPNLGELWPQMTLEGILHSVAKSAKHG